LDKIAHTREWVSDPVAQLPGPGSAVGPARERPPGQCPDHGIGRPGLGERREYARDRARHFLVGVDDDRAVLVMQEIQRQWRPQLAPLGRGPFGALQPAREQVQLCFLW